MTWVLLRCASRARRQCSSIPSASSNRQARSSDGPDSWGDTPREMSRWQIEMYDFARDMRADMDTKMRVLQTLIGQAQQQAQRLEAATDKAERLGVAECRDTLQEIKRVTSQPLVMDDLNICLDSALPRLEPVRLEQDGPFRDGRQRTLRRIDRGPDRRHAGRSRNDSQFASQLQIVGGSTIFAEVGRQHLTRHVT